MVDTKQTQSQHSSTHHIMFTLETVEVEMTKTLMEIAGSKSTKMAAKQAQNSEAQAAYSHEVREPVVTSSGLIDEQLLRCALSSRPTRRGRNEGSSWSTQSHRPTSERVVSSLNTSDKDRRKRAVVEPTLLNANCYCQRFSPETLPHFLKGEDESGLKRRLKCWSAWSSSSGDSVNEKGGCAQRGEVWPFSVF